MMQPKVDCLSESDAKRLAYRKGHAEMVTETRFVSASVGRRVRRRETNKDVPNRDALQTDCNRWSNTARVCCGVELHD